MASADFSVALDSFLAVCRLPVFSVTLWPRRLNKKPEVKRFVKEEGHADTYAELTVDYIKGHNPDLVIFDDALVEIERIDLSLMKTDEIHDLMKAKGFTRKMPEL